MWYLMLSSLKTKTFLLPQWIACVPIQTNKAHVIACHCIRTLERNHTYAVPGLYDVFLSIKQLELPSSIAIYYYGWEKRSGAMNMQQKC